MDAAKLDAAVRKFDALSGRFDAFCAARKDAEEKTFVVKLSRRSGAGGGVKEKEYQASSAEEALKKAKKHKHKAGKDGKCSMCDKVMNEEDDEGDELDEKGKKPKKEFGAKNNDSEED